MSQYINNGDFYDYALLGYLSFMDEIEYNQLFTKNKLSEHDANIVKFVNDKLDSKIIFIDTNYIHDPDFDENTCTSCNSCGYCCGGRTDAQMLMLRTKDDNLIFSFRGSESLTDIGIDMTTCKTEFSCLKNMEKANFTNDTIPHIHKGFYSQFNDLNSIIVNFIIKNKDKPINKLIFCGHSLGGALAVIAASAFSLMYKDIYPVMCFSTGAPLVGDQNFCDFYNEFVNESYNLIYRYDPAPHMPLICCFSRQKKTIHINDDLTIDNDVDYDISEACCMLCCIFPLLCRCTKKYDHHIERYLKIIKKLKY